MHSCRCILLHCVLRIVSVCLFSVCRRNCFNPFSHVSENAPSSASWAVAQLSQRQASQQLVLPSSLVSLSFRARMSSDLLPTHARAQAPLLELNYC